MQTNSGSLILQNSDLAVGIFFFVSVVFALQCSSFVYAADSNAGSAYLDAGFSTLPDLSTSAATIIPIVSVLHASSAVILFVSHPFSKVILRRTLLIFSVSCYLEIAQRLCTTWPCPNRHLGQRQWFYDLQVTQCTTVTCMIAFFFGAPLGLVAFLVQILMMLMVIATRTLYSVDTLCGIFPPLLVFLLYHWYCRSSAAITKRRWVSWLEDDALFMMESDRHTSTTQSHDGAESFVQLTLCKTIRIPISIGLGIYGPSVVFGATDGRGPTYTTEHAMERVEERLSRSGSNDKYCGTQVEMGEVCSPGTRTFIEADASNEISKALTDKLVRRALQLKWWKPALVAAATCTFGATIGSLNLLSIQFADARRPIGVPLPSDLIHASIPALPDHTADIFLYPAVLATTIFAWKSKFRWIIFSRTGIVYAGSMLFRMWTMIVTSIPDPSPTCATREHPKGTTCGDLVYSGHTVGFLMCALTFRYFTQERLWASIVWVLTGCGLVCIIASRLHYTRDVFTSLMVITIVNHLARVLLFKRLSFIHHNVVGWTLECGYFWALSRHFVDSVDVTQTSRIENPPLECQGDSAVQTSPGG